MAFPLSFAYRILFRFEVPFIALYLATVKKKKLLFSAVGALSLMAALSGGLKLYLGYQEASKLKVIDQLLRAKRFSEAIEQSIELFHLNHTNCRPIVLEALSKQSANGEEVVAQTNFDQVVRLDPERDAFLSANRLVLTLVHEFIHCDQHERLYEYLRRNNARLGERLKDYHQLKTFAQAIDDAMEKGGSDKTQLQETEKLLSQNLSPLAKYLENAFEIDALVHVVGLHSLLPEESEEFRFHISYLTKALQHETQRRNGDLINTCNFRRDIEDEIATPYEESCKYALSLVARRTNSF